MICWFNRNKGIFIFSPLSHANGEIQICWFNTAVGCELFQRLHRCTHLCDQYPKTCGQPSPVVKSGIWSFVWHRTAGHCTHWVAKVICCSSSGMQKVFRRMGSVNNIYCICFFFCRYDHLSVLCELMPLGLHSLASCLQTLLHG